MTKKEAYMGLKNKCLELNEGVRAEWTCNECGGRFTSVITSFNKSIVSKLCEKQVCLQCLEKIQAAVEKRMVRKG